MEERERERGGGGEGDRVGGDGGKKDYWSDRKGRGDLRPGER